MGMETQVETKLHPVLSYDWGLMAPELVVLVTAILVLVCDLLLPRKNPRRFLGAFAVLGVLLAMALMIAHLGGEPKEILGEQFRMDAFSQAFKLIILAAVAFSLVQIIYDGGRKEADTRAEYLYLMLTAALGAMIMVSSADLIPMYIGLETMSIASYIMAGIRKRDVKSNEAAFKYIVYGGAASAALLYGFSFIYGLTGSTNLYTIGERLPEAWNSGYSFILMIGFGLMLVGFGFKVSTVPFHMWAPDVYEGSPIPTVSFLSVASKAAGLAMMMRVFFLAFYGDLMESKLPAIGWLLSIVAAASMIIGTTTALHQVDVKRLMAYSSIGQAGYLLVPFAMMSTLMFDQMLFFLVAYLLMNLGLFTVLLVVGQSGDTNLRIFAGLYRRSPWLALAATLFLLSLAGFPFTAGFFGKFYILLGTLAMGNWWLPVLMAVTTVISYAFYFKIVRQMYLRVPAVADRLKVPPVLGLLILFAAVGTLVLGVYPGLAFDLMHQYFPVIQQFFTPATPAL
jgi:NADH-quinone oxidoreductase subunit N